MFVLSHINILPYAVYINKLELILKCCIYCVVNNRPSVAFASFAELYLKKYKKLPLITALNRRVTIMARRNRDDDLLLEEDELTAAFLSEDEGEAAKSEATEEPQYVPTAEDWDEEESVPGQLAVDVYETKAKLVV